MECILPSRRVVVAFIGGLITALAVAISFSVWQWVLANTHYIEPDGDLVIGGTATGCDPAGNYTCLADGLTLNDTPNTGTNYVSLQINQSDRYSMENLPQVDTATEIDVNVFHVQVTDNLGVEVSLYDGTTGTQYGDTVLLPLRTSAAWDTATFTGLSLNQTQMDNLAVEIACPRSRGGGQTNDCRVYSLHADVTYDAIPNITVASIGEQQQVEAGVNNQYIGGAFTFVENVGTSQIQEVTFTDTGNVDLSGFTNIRMYYDLDTTSPYDCTSVSYDGTQPLFGTAGTFDATGRTITFTDDVTASTTQSLCAYLVVDVDENAESGTSFEPEISDPQTDVTFDTLFIEPDTAVALTGFSGVLRTNLTQIGYHWRNDDGGETDATSATEGLENTTFDAAPREQTLRLRMAVSNEGNLESEPKSYQLEYATRVTTCDAANEWEAVGSTGALWNMSSTTNLTDGNDTTNIAVATGGITDPNDTFLTPNAGVRDTTSLTGPLTLAGTEFVELEFAIEASDAAGDGVEYCFRVTDSGTEIDTYDTYPQATTFSDLTVSAIGEQIVDVSIPTANVYSGGAFRITDQTIGAHEVQQITIAASTTVADLGGEIENIRLFYDLDTTAPYDCTSEAYDGTQAQYGTTTSSFDGVHAATFTDSVFVDPEQSLCLYVVYDVPDTTTDGTKINFRINNPAEDVVIDTGDIGPSALVALSGTTRFVEEKTTQTNYHWRNNDGDELEATSATFGTPDVPREQLRIGIPTRLRLAVANLGGLDAPARSFRLEWARRISTCEAVSEWTDVGATGGAWEMSPSANLTDGENTTNIPVETGGVPDPVDTFVSENSGVKDTASQVDPLVLPGHTFTQLEFSLVATEEAIEGGEYCFRVSDAGTAIDAYDIYVQAQIANPTDFFVQRGSFDMTGTTQTLTAGIDYEAPAASDRAFLRITNTLNTGAGGQQDGNAEDVTVRISDPDNITNSVTFERPAAAGGETRVAWELVEYVGASGGQNELVVRSQGTATYGDTNATVSTPTISGVQNNGQVVVFVTGQLNPDTGTNYQQGNTTADWDGGTNTAVFTRGATGNASGVSYAVVEFTGENWQIQRSEHTYTAAGATETETINPVNSLSRSFLHTQKRMGAGQSTHGDFGHQVWLSGIGQISYALDSTASDPTVHTSVAWVIENTQVAGQRMRVTRSNGSQSSGPEPTLLAVDIGTTLSDIAIASIFMNNTGTETGGQGADSFPEPLMSAEIISDTQYQLYIADTDDSRSWRTEVVEWPTAARTFTQNYYRFYVDNDTLTPDTPWPEAGNPVGENSPITIDDFPVGFGQSFRLRMSVEINAAGKVPGIDAFTLQYGEMDTTCAAVNEWHDVEGPTDSSLWRGHVTSVTPGTPLSSDPPDSNELLLSVSNVAATYEEGSPSDFTPYAADPGENIEFDWSVEHNGAADETEYCFRLIESNGLEFIEYNFYPRLLTAAYKPVVLEWQWFTDATELTPMQSLAGVGVTPIDLQNTEQYTLRVNLAETAGGVGEDVKFALQFSEDVNFNQSVTTLVATSTCAENSLWCYADVGGTNNTLIESAVLPSSDNCSGGTGDGCGVYNTSTSSQGLAYTHQPFAVTEHSFSLEHAGARANAVYYFRLFDLTNDEVVPASTTNASVNAEGAQLVFTVSGVPENTELAGVTTDFETTANSVNFNNIPLNQSRFAAQELTIDTNATDGYQVLLFADQQPTNTYGDIIPSITGTNVTPSSWSSGCDLTSQTGCFGYHPTDATLAGGSTRFSAFDTYAALSTAPEEVMYSAIPSTDIQHIIYRTEVGIDQPAGDYETDIGFLAVPRF